MGFTSLNGYTPETVAEILEALRVELNTQFSTSYTAETFVGSNWYKFLYVAAQRMQENEIKTSEIFTKLQDYIATTNEAISRPVNTNPGLLERLEADGYVASIKKPIDADAGKVFVCVDTDELAAGYAATKLAINTIIKNSTAAGVVSQGTETSAIALTNGQTFDFKFNLPNRLTTHLRLTVTLSDNNQNVVLSPEEQKQILLDNIEERYRLGKNFEPQRYFDNIVDAPWAESVLLEWSTNAGANWYSTVYVAAYNDLFVVDLANITLVEA